MIKKTQYDNSFAKCDKVQNMQQESKESQWIEIAYTLVYNAFCQLTSKIHLAKKIMEDEAI